MHILFIPSWYPAHPEDICGSFFREQAKLLFRAGHRVGVLCCYSTLDLANPKHWLGLVEEENDEGIHTVRVRYPSGVRGYLRLMLPSVMRKGFQRYCCVHGQPDIIHAQVALQAGVLARQLARRYSVPYVVTEHKSSIARALWRKSNLNQARVAFRDAKAVMAVSSFLESQLRENLGIERDITVVGNPLDESFESASILDTLAKDNKPFRFLHVGHLHPIKQQDILIEAFAAGFKGTPCELHIGGHGIERDKLAELIARHGMEDQVTLLGQLARSEVLRRMKESDVFVLSSKYETFGVVLIEALACGKPVVATNCGGPTDIVRPGNGVLVEEVYSSEALADGMKYVYEHYKQYDSELIREDCLTRFGALSFVKTVTDIYQKASNRS